MKKLVNSSSNRFRHIPAIDVVVENSDVEKSLELARRSNAMPLHRRIKSDRLYGVKSDVYPYESVFDDESDAEAMNVDKDVDFRRSKWTTYSEACKDNSSRVRQTPSAEPEPAGDGEVGKDNKPKPSQE